MLILHVANALFNASMALAVPCEACSLKKRIVQKNSRRVSIGAFGAMAALDPVAHLYSSL
jgi:hypothetical protein